MSRGHKGIGLSPAACHVCRERVSPPGLAPQGHCPAGHAATWDDRTRTFADTRAPPPRQVWGSTACSGGRWGVVLTERCSPRQRHWVLKAQHRKLCGRNHLWADHWWILLSTYWLKRKEPHHHHVTTWTPLEDTILCERSHSRNDKPCGSHLQENRQIPRDRKQEGGCQGCGQGWGQSVSLGR